MEAMNYVKPELIVVAFVLYFFGVALPDHNFLVGCLSF